MNTVEEQECVDEEENFDGECEDFDSNVLTDIFARTTYYVDSFFQDKCMHCGGAVPKHLLHNPKRMSKVVNTTISESVDQAYNALEKTIDPEELKKAEQFGNVTDDIKLVNETFNMLANFKIPKCFAGGIMLMYLEFVIGIDI